MEDIGSLISAIALWIGLSCGLWWLHRRRVHGRQDRQLGQAKRAIVLTAEAPPVFDAIRVTVEPAIKLDANPDTIKPATHALLKRIQEQGGFFDTVNDLRVQLQASLAIDDHPPLSEVLNLRRDLWAASEILLIDDPGAFGPSFAEPGAYERIRGEAVHLLFKQPEGAVIVSVVPGQDGQIGIQLVVGFSIERHVAPGKHFVALFDRAPEFGLVFAVKNDAE